MSHQHVILIEQEAPPTVEIDTTVSCAYVRFKNTPVVKTVEVQSEDGFSAIDYDAKNQVVGVELIGVQDFSVRKLLRRVSIKAPNIDPERVRYITARKAKGALQEA